VKASTQARSAASQTGARPEPTFRKRALVVDQDAGVLAFAAEALHSFRPGFDVATAHSVEEATAWLDTFSPDLLLLGLDPSSSAEHLSVALRSDPRTAHCQIVVMAQKPAAELRLNPVCMRAQAVLAKPIGLKTLLTTVRRLL